MKVNEDGIIEIARSWLNTPWHHNQNKKGLGVDCVNFLASVAIESGYDIPPIPKKYGRIATSTEIEDYLDVHFIRKNRTKELNKTDLLLFKYSGYNTHVAIATSENTIIHASLGHGKVIEHPIDGVWWRILKNTWSFEKRWLNY